MNRPFVGTLHLDDYNDIQGGMAVARDCASLLVQRGVRIDVQHTHRWWEYGSAIQVLMDHYQERLPQIKTLEVGAGCGALSPALHLRFAIDATEYEPDDDCYANRVKCNEVMTRLGRSGMHVHRFSLETMPSDSQQYDAVMCVSVLEHVNPEIERAAWKWLADRVKPGGFLYITTDCVEDKSVPHMCDELRTQNFTVDDLRQRVEFMQHLGLTPLGHPDWTFNGRYVYDYTFFRAAFIKDGNA